MTSAARVTAFALAMLLLGFLGANGAGRAACGKRSERLNADTVDVQCLIEGRHRDR